MVRFGPREQRGPFAIYKMRTEKKAYNYDEETKSILYIIIAALCFSSSNLFVKRPGRSRRGRRACSAMRSLPLGPLL